MSSFEKSILELIEELCPNGVEYKKLREAFVQFSGMSGAKEKWKNKGNCRFIDYMNAYKNLKININIKPWATVNKMSQNVLKRGDILLTSASETPDECAIASVIEGDIEDNIFLDDHLFGIRVNEQYKRKINTTFVMYYMHSEKFRIQVNKAVRGVTRFYISKVGFMEMEIPIPPLKVQEKIIEILDSFSESTDKLQENLEKELDLRKKQYEYYRDDLLKFSDGNAKVYTLDEICDITAGGDIKKENVRKTKDETYKYPVYSNGIEENALYGYTNTYKKENCITVSGRGTIGWVAYRPEKFYPIIRLICLKANEKIIESKFLKYCLQNIEFESTYGGIPQLTVPMIKKYEVWVPPIEKQKQIVEILDPLEKATQSLTEGIPAEIEGRKKQYEYYRDKLLNFKRKADKK